MILAGILVVSLNTSAARVAAVEKQGYCDDSKGSRVTMGSAACSGRYGLGSVNANKAVEDAGQDEFPDDGEAGYLARGIPAVDTLVAWKRVTAADTFLVVYNVDENGDTLSFRLRNNLSVAEHLRTWGPYADSKASRGKHFAAHRITFNTPGSMAWDGDDFCTDSGMNISDLTSFPVLHTEDGVLFKRSWRYAELWHHADTLDVTQTVWMSHGRPYLNVRYDLEFVSQGVKSDSLRFLWRVKSQCSPHRSRHDVGWVPGYGNVFTCHVFSAEEVGYAACAMNLGNPMTSYQDNSFRDAAIRIDYGSGDSTWASAGFIWKSDEDIVPFEIAYIDTILRHVPSLHADSMNMHVDTTEIYSHGERWIYARTPWYVFSQGETRSMEFAVFRGYIIGDVLPPVWPEIIWSDGTVSRIPGRRKRN